MDLLKTSIFISFILRHKPETIGIQLDVHGWDDVEELLRGLSNHGHKITKAELEEIVVTDDKQRYSFNADKTKIRANQGHSVKVDLELKAAVPPNVLYHGTVQKYIDNIAKTGLKKQNRHHVHLLADIETASIVAKRRGEPIILVIDSRQMYLDGYEFYLSDNGVWLVDDVPVKYISRYLGCGITIKLCNIQ